MSIIKKNISNIKKCLRIWKLLVIFATDLEIVSWLHKESLPQTRQFSVQPIDPTTAMV